MPAAAAAAAAAAAIEKQREGHARLGWPTHASARDHTTRHLAPSPCRLKTSWPAEGTTCQFWHASPVVADKVCLQGDSSALLEVYNKTFFCPTKELSSVQNCCRQCCQLTRLDLTFCRVKMLAEQLLGFHDLGHHTRNDIHGE